MQVCKTKSPHNQPAFYIDQVPVYNQLVLAPMDGYTDSPFRRMAKKHGAGLVYTEFINAMDIVNGSPSIKEKLVFYPEERPIGFQIFDNDLDRLQKAAEILWQNYLPDFIDINLGCPNRRVVSRGAGAALLKQPEYIQEILSTLSRTLEIPITAKIRLGPDDESKNFLQIAQIIQDNGGKCIAIHGRTTKQGLKGEVDWHAIAALKNHVKIPVIGNGSIISPDDINLVKTITHCDGIMIGRGAIGNPWIFLNKTRVDIRKDIIIDTMLEQLSLSLSLYGEETGLLVFRKHAVEYVKDFNLEKANLIELLTCKTEKRFKEIALRI